MMNQSFSRLALSAFLGGALCLSLPAEAGGPFQFFTLTPCRLADTRDLDGPSGGPILEDQIPRQFPVQGLCNVPIGAAAVTVNVTAVVPNGPGFLTLFPSGIATPVVSSLNFAAGELALGNGAIVPLADQIDEPLDLSVFPRVLGSGTVHMVLDVTGYFSDLP